jgi:hypothetical protein
MLETCNAMQATETPRMRLRPSSVFALECAHTRADGGDKNKLV